MDMPSDPIRTGLRPGEREDGTPGPLVEDRRETWASTGGAGPQARPPAWLIGGALVVAALLLGVFVVLVRTSTNEPPPNDRISALSERLVDPFAHRPAEIRKVQDLLRREGYPVGRSDGVLGRRTREAIAAFEQARGWEKTGDLSAALLREAVGAGRLLAGGPATTAGGAAAPLAVAPSPR